MSIPSTLSDWLKSSELKSVATDSGIAAAWGDNAVESEIRAPLALPADAAIEAVRQLGFLSPPKALETIRVPGQRVDLLGQSQTIIAGRGGYEAGIAIFIVGAEELEDDNATILTVIRRMT